MNLKALIYICIMVFSNCNDGFNKKQQRVHRISNFTVGLNKIKSTTDHLTTQIYFNAIKETFDRYYRDKQYKNGRVCESNQTFRDIVYRYESYSKLKANFYRNCSHVIGNVVISHISGQDISFLNSIEEISGYLLIFGNSIETILLPNLKVIRGEDPWIRRGQLFSLVVSNNFLGEKMLKYLVMPSLQVILRYNILFNESPGLRYISNKINWDFLIGKDQQVLIVENETSTSLIDKVKPREFHCHQSCQWYLGSQYCWGNTSFSCQQINECLNRTCSEDAKCFINKHGRNEECCHDECAGGCTGPTRKQCLACKNFNDNGSCVEYCPSQPHYKVSGYEQNHRKKLAFHYMCVDKCPVKFFEEFGNCVPNCTIQNTYPVNQTCKPCPNNICPKVCRSKDVQTHPENPSLNRKMLDRLQNCTIYDGNIEISSFSIEGDIFHNISREEYGIRENDLQKLETLTEIYGFLKIHVGSKAPWLKSLFFLKNLQIIRAETINSHKSHGLAIYNNKHLQFLGLNKLREVRNKGIIIIKNPALCLAATLTRNSLKRKGKVRIHDNGSSKNCSQFKCSRSCKPKLGCWSPLPTSCIKCKDYKVVDTNLCVSNCSLLPVYFYAESNKSNSRKTCSKCHEECSPGLNTCHGSEANQCNLGCKNHILEGYCVSKCPKRHYSDKSSKNVCIPCDSACTSVKKESTEPVCTGPNDYIGNNGCRHCNQALLKFHNSDIAKSINESYLIKCLHLSDCPTNYFKHIMDFSSDTEFSSLRSKLSDNNISTQISQRWSFNRTSYEKSIGFICLPCHPLCIECDGAKEWHCKQCKYFRFDNKCVANCQTDFYAQTLQSEENDTQNECMACHYQCEEGCYGPTEYDCKKCKRAKIFLNNTANEFFCNSTCGDLKEVIQGSEMICTDGSRSFTLIQYIAASMIVFLSLIVISSFTGCIIYCTRKKKILDMTLRYFNEFYSTETDEISGVVPNMATLLLITESQLTREKIIGSGAFGVVYRGIWQPNIDSINNSNSFLKRNLSRLTKDASIKLLVAVKILTDISDPANNRELLEEAKVMASVDHPCCLRILAVCLTAHPKLITQFMPLGSLLEFCQRHRSVINNTTLLVWAKQIACGMEYLESKGIIHCDLAARNVLVQSPRQVKITDFGLAKVLDHSQQHYQFKGGRMPIKWLAIECIRNRMFSSKSDVWSYGVTLWEMFTFGEKPFPDIKAFDILEHLEKGQRLNQPRICSIDAYTILIQCWLVDPDARPCFTELKKTFEMMSSNPNRYLLIQNNEMDDPFYVDWEDDAQKYDEFLQALVTVPHLNSEQVEIAPRPVSRKHIKSVKNQYREMRTYKNCFIYNEIYDNANGQKESSNFTNPDYTSISFQKQEKTNSNETRSTWSEYDESKNNRMSVSTMMTNINTNYDDFLKRQMLNADLFDDGYLIPKANYEKKLMCNYSYLSSAEEKPDVVIYFCENSVEREVLINDESSI